MTPAPTTGTSAAAFIGAPPARRSSARLRHGVHWRASGTTLIGTPPARRSLARLRHDAHRRGSPTVDIFSALSRSRYLDLQLCALRVPDPSPPRRREANSECRKPLSHLGGLFPRAPWPAAPGPWGHFPLYPRWRPWRAVRNCRDGRAPSPGVHPGGEPTFLPRACTE